MIQFCGLNINNDGVILNRRSGISIESLEKIKWFIEEKELTSFDYLMYITYIPEPTKTRDHEDLVLLVKNEELVTQVLKSVKEQLQINSGLHPENKDKLEGFYKIRTVVLSEKNLPLFEEIQHYA